MAEYFTLEFQIERREDHHWLSVSRRDPRSQARHEPVGAPVSFDLDQLRAEQAQPDSYGALLSAQLFADPTIEAAFTQVEREADSADHFMRVVIAVHSSAAELQSLRWELLRHPGPGHRAGAPLATSQHVLLSRFIPSRDPRPLRLSSREKLRAVVAVSAPPAKRLGSLAPVDFEAESSRAVHALEGIEPELIGAEGDPCTLTRLVEACEGVDVLYLAAHGVYRPSTGEPYVYLQEPDGGLHRVEGAELTRKIAELQSPPRLVVLASCESAGEGQVRVDDQTSVQDTLAGRLADAGVAAILAMQGKITMTTVEQMMPRLFRELVTDGQIDRALAAARGVVEARDDMWMPALYSRLTDGRLWQLGGGRSPDIIDFTAERSRHEHFFGRDTIFTQIDQQLDAGAGWVVVTAGPGVGKSALLSRWLTRREDAGLRTAHHFVRRGHQNWAEPAAIRANLAAQIEAMFPELAEAETNPDPKNRLETLLDAVPEPVVLLVDGLDEAMTIGDKDNPIPKIFPATLAEGASVVVASRPRYPHLNWFRQRTRPAYELDLDADGKSNTGAVQGFWQALGPKMEPALTAAQTGAAIEGAQGNLLHAVKLRQLWMRPGATRDPKDVPKGLEGVLGELWGQLEGLPDEQWELVSEGLALLCAAQESLSMDLVEVLLKWRGARADGTSCRWSGRCCWRRRGGVSRATGPFTSHCGSWWLGS